MVELVKKLPDGRYVFYNGKSYFTLDAEQVIEICRLIAEYNESH